MVLSEQLPNSVLTLDEAQTLSLANGSHHWRIWQRTNISTMSDREFGAYMAGLIEGDGCFEAAGLNLEFDVLDFSLARMICVHLNANLKKHLKYIKASPKSSEKAEGSYSIFLPRDHVSFITLYNLVNGLFVGPFKVQQLKHHRLNGFNMRVAGPGKTKYEWQQTSTLLPADAANLGKFWLTGFFEADGCVTVCRTTCACRIISFGLLVFLRRMVALLYAGQLVHVA